MLSKTSRFVFVALCILIGLYPIIYAFIDRRFGLLSTKSEALLADTVWNLAFYTHISLGGLALLIGWIQFSQHFRERHLKLHRRIGKIYLISVLFSAVSGLYIALFATGGFISSFGFICLGMIWLFSSAYAYRLILKKDLLQHRIWMGHSYAACFAAVTLRIWLPLLIAMTGEFEAAYRIVAWLCWIPNLLYSAYLHRQILNSDNKLNIVN